MSAPPLAACAEALRVVLAAQLGDPTGEASDDPAVALEALQGPGRRPRPVLRAVLATVSAAQLVVAVPWIFGWNVLSGVGVHAMEEHLARDGVIGVLVGVAGLVTARTPRHAVPMLVTALAAFGLQVIGFAVDEGHDRVTAIFETQHVLVLVVTALIAVLAFRRSRPVEQPSRRPLLHVVR